MQRIIKAMEQKYKKQARTDDYAKYSVKTIIGGYGKTGI